LSIVCILLTHYCPLFLVVSPFNLFLFRLFFDQYWFRQFERLFKLLFTLECSFLFPFTLFHHIVVDFLQISALNDQLALADQGVDVLEVRVSW
jgi:hypothetical protein